MINPTALQLVDTLCDNASKEWCDVIHALHETAHAEGVAEGAEQERERIRNGSKYEDCHDDSRWCGRPDGDFTLAFWHVPAAVLAPKPERGKPSQALLDELSEICGEKVEYEPKARP